MEKYKQNVIFGSLWGLMGIMKPRETYLPCDKQTNTPFQYYYWVTSREQLFLTNSIQQTDFSVASIADLSLFYVKDCSRFEDWFILAALIWAASLGLMIKYSLLAINYSFFALDNNRFFSPRYM